MLGHFNVIVLGDWLWQPLLSSYGTIPMTPPYHQSLQDKTKTF